MSFLTLKLVRFLLVPIYLLLLLASAIFATDLVVSQTTLAINRPFGFVVSTVSLPIALTLLLLFHLLHQWAVASKQPIRKLLAFEFAALLIVGVAYLHFTGLWSQIANTEIGSILTML